MDAHATCRPSEPVQESQIECRSQAGSTPFISPERKLTRWCSADQAMSDVTLKPPSTIILPDSRMPGYHVSRAVVNYSNILIRATNWVGDAVMCLPALHAIRQRFPEARIAILAKPWVADLYRHGNLVDEIIPFTEKWPMIRNLRSRDF